MTTLDDIRREIANRHERAVIDSRVADQQMALAKAELAAHDRAVAAMPNGATKPERTKRRDIAEEVRAALTDKPQSLKQLAKKTGVVPSRLRLVLGRMKLDGEAIAASSDNKTFWCPP